MTKDYFIKLTLALYKTTDLFPEGEPLKFSIRKKANSILSSLVLAKSNPISLGKEEQTAILRTGLKETEVLQSYFQLAEEQNWADARNFIVLKREYHKIQEFLDKEMKGVSSSKGIKEKSREKTPTKRVEGGRNNLPAVEKQILQILNKEKDSKTDEIGNSLSEVSSRCIRKHLKILREKGLVRKNKIGREIFYNLNRKSAEIAEQ